MSGDFVTKEVCDLHHQLTEAKIANLEQCDEKHEKRMDTIESKIDGVYEMQKKQMTFLIYVAVGVSITLFGVIIGRGVDFGMLFP